MSDVARGAQSNYSILTTKKLKELPIGDLADPDGSILALWAPSSLLADGLDLMKAYGFKHKQTYVWVKNKKNISSNLNDSLAFGMGRLFRQTHEIALIGINNNKIYKKLANKSQRSVSFGENIKHSAKPEHLQNSLDLMFPNFTKLELFSRRQRHGWVCVGNEAPMSANEDIQESLNKLLSYDNNYIQQCLLDFSKWKK
jgi:N6-adenosine-specific RNA methylase IME4